MTMLERLSWNPLNLLLLLKHSWCFKRYLTHSFPMHPFSTAWKHPKTGEVGKGCIGNEWVKIKLVARKASVAHLPSRVQLHCVKRVQIRSFFWSIFSRIRPEYRKILSVGLIFTRNWCSQFISILMKYVHCFNVWCLERVKMIENNGTFQDCIF